MGEILESFEPSRGRPPKYQWEEWTDGKARRLHQGEDFDAALDSFRTMAFRKARDLGLKVHTDINKADASISVQFVPKQ